jgi:excisionase family DNA binding protein
MAASKPSHPNLTDLDMLDAAEVAELLRMRVSTVLDLARRGVIPGHKIGRRWIFLRDEIETTVRRAPGSRPSPTAAPPPAKTEPPDGRRSRGHPRAARSQSPAQAKLFG